jgi:DNA-binding MarR family transcriptional regulator/N-acetylglutamate synthase-like GNAT family acetyltransferase
MPTKRDAAPGLEVQVDALRRFNRFFTRQVGALEEHLLDSTFSLAEARVVYELANRERPTATELGTELRLDPGYLSRILLRLKKRGLVAASRSETDRRQSHLRLTKRGEKAFGDLDTRSREENAALLRRLSERDRERLLQAARGIQVLLGAPDIEPPVSYLLRAQQPGDLGWVVSRHGAVYAAEYGWDERFEALVAGIVARFVHKLDPQRERCWIAEMAGEPVGSVFLVQASKTVAQLRLLLVEPRARGLGIGRRLIEECVRFARRAGFRRIRLWTQSILHGARHLYEEAGFRKVGEERHESFGFPLVGETWELEL